MHANQGAGLLIAGRYRLQDPIGRGSMGIVWRGLDELLHAAIPTASRAAAPAAIA